MISVTRKEPGAFAADDVQLLQTFADQAVIAIQNARLFNETQEALEQQKASAEVLGAISKSVADTAPVFETILDACQRLFGGEEIGIYTIGDDQMVRAAAGAARGPRKPVHDVTPLAESVTGRVIRERRTHHIPDLGALPNLSPTLRERVDRHGGASLLYAPMLWEDSGLGSILVVRWPPRPFSDREQALLQTLRRSGGDRDPERAAVQRDPGGAGAAEGLCGRAGRDQQIRRRCGAGVRNDPRRLPAAVRRPKKSTSLPSAKTTWCGSRRLAGRSPRKLRHDVTPLAESVTGRVISGTPDPPHPRSAAPCPIFRRALSASGCERYRRRIARLCADAVGGPRRGSIVVSALRRRGRSATGSRRLLQSFADQAAIAIQNARLFERDRKEALQTADRDQRHPQGRSPSSPDDVRRCWKG